MRRFILSATVTTLLIAGAAATAPASAAVIAQPATVQDAARAVDAVQDVRYRCTRTWRHGRWHRRCWWEPNRGRHRGWRHRHHRRWH